MANLGLVKAVQGFDPSHGSDFLSFAVPTIRGEIRRYFRDFGWTIRPPRSVQELQTKITAAEGELYQALGRSPRPSEVAEHLGVDLDLVVDSLAANGCFAPMSLDTPAADGESGPVDRLGGLDAAFGSAEARIALAPLLKDLTPRERRILEMRFFGGCHPGRDRRRGRRHPDAGLAPARPTARPAAQAARGGRGLSRVRAAARTASDPARTGRRSAVVVAEDVGQLRGLAGELGASASRGTPPRPPCRPRSRCRTSRASRTGAPRAGRPAAPLR